jgi:hypothetical protein
MPRSRALCLLAASLACAACGGLSGEPPHRPPTVKGPDGKPRYVTEHGPYKATYDRWGRLERIDHDSNGDGKPDRILRHDGAKKPHSIDVDVDFDGRIDRWEKFTPEGALLRWAVADKGRARMWTVVASDGTTPARYEYDSDGDGQIERAEIVVGSRIGRVELDTDRDGKIDRWQEWDGAKLTLEAMDTDADGRPDRRLHYAEGRIQSVERLTP